GRTRPGRLSFASKRKANGKLSPRKNGRPWRIKSVAFIPARPARRSLVRGLAAHARNRYARARTTTVAARKIDISEASCSRARSWRSVRWHARSLERDHRRRWRRGWLHHDPSRRRKTCCWRRSGAQRSDCDYPARSRFAERSSLRRRVQFERKRRNDRYALG